MITIFDSLLVNKQDMNAKNAITHFFTLFLDHEVSYPVANLKYLVIEIPNLAYESGK